jgi:hypothetical protein
MERTCGSKALLEVGFAGETGFGAAVTQSFFSQCAIELTRKDDDIPLWVDGPDAIEDFLYSRRGLAIAPLAEYDPRKQTVCRRFRFLGRLIAKALQEDFLVPLPLTPEVFQLVLSEPLKPKHLPMPGDGWHGEVVGALAAFAADLAATPEEDRARLADDASWAKTYLKASYDMSFSEACEASSFAFVAQATYGPPLCLGGADRPVNLDSLEEFVQLATEFWLGSGVSDQVAALRAGIDDVFDADYLAFSAQELRTMVCGESSVEWTQEQLCQQLEWTRGLAPDKAPASWLVQTLVELAPEMRSQFLDFVSSCPSLPPGGLQSLGIQVHLLSDAAPDRLPRARACANTLYIPKYDSKEQMQEKLLFALQNFHGMHEVAD